MRPRSGYEEIKAGYTSTPSKSNVEGVSGAWWMGFGERRGHELAAATLTLIISDQQTACEL